MVSFIEATDGELKVMCDAIDAVALTQPGLIHENECWCRLVHAVMNEIHARRYMHQLIAELTARDDLAHDMRYTVGAASGRETTEETA